MTFVGRACFCLAALVAAMALAVPVTAQGGRGGQRGGRGAAPRDNVRPVQTGTGVIAGRVVAADTGRPLKRARVMVTGGGRPAAATTDEQGRYRVAGLPAGTYRVHVSKTGFVDEIFGQRRALRDGSPIDLADNQQVADADVKLARGGVITGHVFDEDGEPLARAVVTVLRSQYVRGERQLAPAGTPDQTDDRGQFRIFGLPPGNYFVSAAAGGLDRIAAQVAQRIAPGAVLSETANSTGYAPTYYPGVVTSTDARPLKLGASQELGGVDFSIQVVPFATVRGVVTGGGAMVILVADSGIAAGGGRGPLGAALGAVAAGQNLRAQTLPDGSFTIPNVTPGKYTMIARVDAGTDTAKVAVQALVVAGEEVMVALTPVSGVAVSGTITLEAGGAPVPATLAGFRVNLAPLDTTAAAGRGARPAGAGEGGRFTVTGVFPGRYALRATGPRGWVMKTVDLDGRDLTDQPIEVKDGSVGGLNVIFTDQIATLSGVVRDRQGAPAEGLTIVAFPQDEALWQPQSRRIVTARADRTGAYRINMLPAGDYLVVAVDEVEQGEWFDPAFLEQVKGTAIRLTVGDGEQRTQDLRAPSSS